MQDISCKLLSYSYDTDSIGNEIKTPIETECPIIRIEQVGMNEFYAANEQGHKPNLKLIISSLNYNDEEDLIYMDKQYTCYRTTGKYPDEITLICEKRVRRCQQKKLNQMT